MTTQPILLLLILLPILLLLEILRPHLADGDVVVYDVYRLAEPYHPQLQAQIRDYALTYMVMCPDACRYATIDHILGDRADHSLGMLHSVSTSENTRVKAMVDKKGGGYAKVQALYARMFPAAAATA